MWLEAGQVEVRSEVMGGPCSSGVNMLGLTQ